MKPVSQWEPVSMYQLTVAILAVSLFFLGLIAFNSNDQVERCIQISEDCITALQDCTNEKLEWIRYADNLKTELEAR